MNLKIFPATITQDNKKIPLIDSWEQKATNDPNQIRIWQEQFRDRIKLWGAPAGANGLFVLDIDVKGEKNGFESLKNLGITIPQTAYQRTPSGGVHFIFQDDPNIKLRNTANRDLAIDTRSHGGWIGLYNIDWSPGIAPIPAWVHTVVRKPVNQIDLTQQNTVVLNPTFALEQYQKSLQSILGAGTGERNQTLNIHAYVIGKLVVAGAIPYDTAFADLTNAAKSIGLDPYETQATILSGLKGGAANPLTHPFGDAPPVPALKIEAPLPQAETPSRWTPSFATENMLWDWTKLKRPQLFEDWAPQDLTLTSAIGGVGKTTLKLYEAICLALGEPFLGFKCLKPGRTLFVIGEDTEEKLVAMMGRIANQIGYKGQPHKIQAILDGVIIKRAKNFPLVIHDRRLNNYIPNDETLGKLKEAIDDLKPVQIIFDPIGMFAGPESGGNDAAKALMEAMHSVMDMSDAAIDLISHIGKDSATKRDTGQFSARGATAMANHSRVIRTLLKLNSNEYRDVTGEELVDGHTAIQCFVSKFSDGSPILDRPFLIIRDGYLFSRKEIPAHITGVNIDSSKDKQRVFDFIRKNSSEAKPLTENFICDHFNLENPRIAKSITKSIIGTLQFEGLIEKAPHIDERVGEWVRSV